MPVPKLIHIQNGERNFIRFGGKPRLLIEVFQHKAYDGISDSMQEVYDDFERLEVPSVIHHEELDGYFFLFIITQFPEGIKPGFEDRMRRNLEFSAKWYLHQCFRKNL
ncbi:MAG: hypothetical protein PHG67_14340 [Bacteroidales bacterium]|nr:hypothetical protein [Bacteroidales bacterium]